MNSSDRKNLRIYEDIQEVPTEYQKRGCTDICCLIIGVAFTVIMILIALITFNYHNFIQSNYPTDSDGKLCGVDLPNYPYLYFANEPQITQRVCVKSCPNSGDTSLQCSPNSQVPTCSFANAPYYPNQAQGTRGGFFCFPTNSNDAQVLLQNSNLGNRNSFYNDLDTITLSFWVALGVSFIYFVLVQLLPKIMNYVAVVLGLLFLLATAICVFTYSTGSNHFKIVLGLILMFILLFLVISLCKNPQSLKVHAIFLSYATKMFKERFLTFLYIPFFFAILVLFIGLILYEFTAYWTSGNLTYNSSTDIYYSLTGSGATFLTVILAIQTIWGLSFIKQSFNFCVSGNAVLWYYEENVESKSNQNGTFYPLKLQVCKHIGSVIAGSFLTGFFSIFDFVFDVIKPDSATGCYNSFYNTFCSCCLKFFDFIRSDAMAYINLAGNPYCNSSRYCEYLCDKTIIMSYSQSSSRIYRLCAHFFIAGIISIFALYVKGNISIYALGLIIIETIFVSTLFISFHADAAQAIEIIVLEDQQFVNRRAGNTKHDPIHLRNASMRKQLGNELSDYLEQENQENREITN